MQPKILFQAPLASSEPLDEPKEQPQTNGTKISGSQQQSPTNDDSNGAASDGETEQTGTLLRTSRLPGSLGRNKLYFSVGFTKYVAFHMMVGRLALFLRWYRVTDVSNVCKGAFAT